MHWAWKRVGPACRWTATPIDAASNTGAITPTGVEGEPCHDAWRSSSPRQLFQQQLCRGRVALFCTADDVEKDIAPAGCQRLGALCPAIERRGRIAGLLRFNGAHDPQIGERR